MNEVIVDLIKDLAEKSTEIANLKNKIKQQEAFIKKEKLDTIWERVKLLEESYKNATSQKYGRY